MMAAVSEPVRLTLTPKCRESSTKTTTKASGSNPRNVERWNKRVRTDANKALKRVPMVRLMGRWNFFNIGNHSVNFIKMT